MIGWRAQALPKLKGELSLPLIPQRPQPLGYFRCELG